MNDGDIRIQIIKKEKQWNFFLAQRKDWIPDEYDTDNFLDPIDDYDSLTLKLKKLYQEILVLYNALSKKTEDDIKRLANLMVIFANFVLETQDESQEHLTTCKDALALLCSLPEADSTKPGALRDLGYITSEIYGGGNYDLLNAYNKIAIRSLMAIPENFKTDKDKRKIALIYYFYGSCLLEPLNFPFKAVAKWEKSIKILKSIPEDLKTLEDKSNMAKYYSLIGQTYYTLNNWDEAHKNYKFAMELLNAIPQALTFHHNIIDKALNLKTIGLIFVAKKDWKEAEQHFLDAYNFFISQVDRVFDKYAAYTNCLVIMDICKNIIKTQFDLFKFESAKQYAIAGLKFVLSTKLSFSGHNNNFGAKVIHIIALMDEFCTFALAKFQNDDIEKMLFNLIKISISATDVNHQKELLVQQLIAIKDGLIYNRTRKSLLPLFQSFVSFMIEIPVAVLPNSLFREMLNQDNVKVIIEDILKSLEEKNKLCSLISFDNGASAIEIAVTRKLLAQEKEIEALKKDLEIVKNQLALYNQLAVNSAETANQNNAFLPSLGKRKREPDSADNASNNSKVPVTNP